MSGFGVYVHWPYCGRICPYCDFNVYRARGHDPEPLLAALCADIAGHAARLGPRPVDSLFLGGGTPSLLAGVQIGRLIAAVDRSFGFAADPEITLEANPEDAARFADHAAAGVTRFSVGLQALDDAALKALGRAHDAAAGLGAVAAAAATGRRVSADLIYAREGQTLDAWLAELDRALALPVEHLSLYQLTIEPGTAFARKAARGALVPPGPALQADLLAATRARCAAQGMAGYEVSNFARAAPAQSRHNLVYWRSGDWLGIGPGAHGRIRLEGRRCATVAPDGPAAYAATVAAGGVGWTAADPLTEAEARQEALMMALRLTEGAPRGLVPEGAALADLAAAGLAVLTADRLRLTEAGLALADRIGAELCALI